MPDGDLQRARILPWHACRYCRQMQLHPFRQVLELALNFLQSSESGPCPAMILPTQRPSMRRRSLITKVTATERRRYAGFT